MEYNKGDKIKVQIANINDIGAFVKLEGRASGMIHYSEVPCKFGQVSNCLEVVRKLRSLSLDKENPISLETHDTISVKRKLTNKQ